MGFGDETNSNEIDENDGKGRFAMPGNLPFRVMTKAAILRDECCDSEFDLNF
jgi:hypothetical protein